MKKKYLLANLLIICQGIAFLIALYMIADYAFSATGLLKRPRIHLTMQLLLSLTILLSGIRFVKIRQKADSMVKHARDQRMNRSKAVEIFTLFLLINIIFNSLFFTYSPGRYITTFIENGIYVICLIMQFLLLANMVTLHSNNAKNSPKINHGYSFVGVIGGLIVYMIYYQLVK